MGHPTGWRARRNCSLRNDSQNGHGKRNGNGDNNGNGKRGFPSGMTTKKGNDSKTNDNKMNDDQKE